MRALLLAGLVAASLGARAQGVDDLTGPWLVSLRDTDRKCNLVLRTEQTATTDRQIAMPAGCRRAMPILVDVGGWTATAGTDLTFTARDGKAVLTFAREDEKTFLASGPEGEIYELAPAGRQQIAQLAPGAQTPGLRQIPGSLAPAGSPIGPARPAAATARAATTAHPATGDPAAVPYTGRPGDLAGRYLIMREGVKDIGCMLTLDDRARGPKGTFKAQLAPACRDQGIVVFDPMGWHLERGRLLLLARKGHSVAFDARADGSWWKDPKEAGKPLGFRKIEY